MILAYVAGPFSAKDRAGVNANIARAVAVGLEIARLGAMPVIPHANTAHPNFESLQPYPFWIEGTMLLLRRCDVLVSVPGWEKSSGARGEVLDAATRGQPVFHSIAEFATWLGSRDDRPTLPAPPPPLSDAEFFRMVGADRNG